VAKMNSRKPKLIKITKKNEYLKMRSGLKISSPGFILQARYRENEDSVDQSSIRYGLTCSKRVGNAVKRNRAKRRLRALVNDIIPINGLKGWDYVLIGKEQTTEKLSFKILEKNLIECLVKLHKIGLNKIEKN
tara:strand:+ start:960 stop:1358 length:399 start_codon:yes stop_codon:yes gene_type:complete